MRSSAWGAAGAAALIATALGGCSLSLDFDELRARDTPDGGALLDATAADDAARHDGQPCADSEMSCDGYDDDCNGSVDEGLLGTTEHCARCGDACGARATCDDRFCSDRAVQIAAGGTTACLRTLAGDVFCWGGNTAGQAALPSSDAVRTPLQVALPGAASFITVGGAHACALVPITTGEAPGLYCWGSNESGQLGVGGLVAGVAPGRAAVDGLPTTVSAGSSHTCVLDADGAVLCAGSNRFLELGRETAGTVSSTFEPTNNGFTAGAIAIGDRFTCASTDAMDQVGCWGTGTQGQLGDGIVTTATDMPRFHTDGPPVGLGRRHGCARGERALRCWGDNLDGQADPKTISSDAEPTVVEGVDGVSSVDGGDAHTCAVDMFGDVYCWGRNDELQLGVPDDEEHGPVAVDLEGATAVQVATGDHFSCALDDLGVIHCWGANDHFQLTRAGSTPQAPGPIELAEAP
jgi:hypothetical protein